MRYGIAEALFKFDDNMEVAPWLAESYEVNDEHTEWTIKLKDGIKFSDGCDLTPTKVKEYFDHMKEVGPSGSAKPEKYLEFEAEVTVDDEANTIFIKTSKPYANLDGAALSSDDGYHRCRAYRELSIMELSVPVLTKSISLMESVLDMN
ncbi:MAG: ABC transporter substrate-binding protein [Blautia massiliensis (ex Durand et al. 2017)]